MLVFEWDENKAESNKKKHLISFEEASTVFNDAFSKFDNDPDHSINEDRFVIIGYSCKNRLLFVSYTDRGEKIRIISSRLATKYERMLYENKN
jgi:uncharacterized protein